MSAAQPPVFVDDTGRRHILTRRAGRIVVIGFTAYLGLVALGFARDPQVGPVHLPTFGLPSLGLMVPPAPVVLGEQATRTAADAPPSSAEQAIAPNGQPGNIATAPDTPAGGGTATPRPTTPPATSAPAGGAAGSRKVTTPATGVPASGTSTTTSPSTSTSTTSSTTTSTTSPGPGQGQGQGAASAATKGPEGSGPPGQLRKTTTTTAG